MIGAGVEVNGDQYLVFVAPHPLCQFYPQPVAQLRGNFSGLKALVGVVGHIAARLAKPLLDRLHLLKGGVPITVHAGDEHGPFRPLNGLFLVGGVVENLLQIRIDGLIRVLSVVHHTGQAVLDGPYFSGRHLVTSRSIHRFRRKRRKLTISRMLLSPQSLTALRGPHIFPAGVGRQELSRQLIQLGRCLLHRLSSEVIPQAVDLPVEVTEPPAGKRRRRLPSAYPPEIPGQGQAALSGLTLQLPLLLLRHPHLDGCRSLSIGHSDPLLSDWGDRGGAPLGAQRRPLWGAPGNTKAMLAAPQDRAVGCSFGGFFSAERWGSCRSIRESSAPFRRRCLAHSLGWEVLAQLSLSDGHLVVRTKKETGT